MRTANYEVELSRSDFSASAPENVEIKDRISRLDPSATTNDTTTARVVSIATTTMIAEQEPVSKKEEKR